MTTVRELKTRLAELLNREHAAMADFLVALAEFDAGGHWETLGYKSLFAFLRRELRLSAGAAQYRKTAAELVREYPAIETALRAGDLCLSSIIELSKVITPENAAEVLPRFFGLSSRDAAFVAASIRPTEAPPRRDFIVTHVRPAAATAASQGEVPSATTPPRPANDSQLRAPEPNAPDRVSLATPAPAARSAPVVPTSIEPLDGERARIHMTVSRRLLDKLDAARDALSHSHPGATRDEIIEAGLDLLLERTAKRRGLVKDPRKKAATSGEPATPGIEPPVAVKDPGRYVAADVRRAIWERDHGQCQWAIDGGGVCGPTYQVEVDHASKAFAKGGRILKAEDGRILCRPHQLVSARREFGDACMDRFTRRKGPTTQAAPPEERVR